MGLFSWIKRNAEDIVDPIGSVVGDNKYVNAGRAIVSGGAAGLSDMGTRRIVEGIRDNGLRGAVGGLNDAATWGAGDVIQPLYTDEEGDNPFYDRIGPIMAGYWGGPLAGMAADYWVQGSKYSEVGDFGGGSIAGIGGSGWGGSGMFDSLFSSSASSGGSAAAGSAGSAGEGGISSLTSSGGSSMGWTDFLPLIGDVISGGASLYGSKKAADTSAEAAKISSDTMLNMFYQNREDLAPWRETGKAALNTLYEKVQAGPGEYTESPGYQFRLSEGEKAINRAAAARGGYDSGKTLKALTKYGQDYATQDYDNFLQRWYQSLNPLASLANVGQIATTDTAKMGTDVAKDVAANTLYAGNARASGYLNSANIFDRTLDSGINNYLMARYLQN